MFDSRDAERPVTRRATKSIGLVLVGTAALMLGTQACDDGSKRGKAAKQGAGSTTRPTGRHGYVGTGGGTGQRAADGTGSAAPSGEPTRGGFGSTGRSAGS